MRTVFTEFRLAGRQLRKSPGFTITVIVTLALGIGTTTAVFSLIEGILLRPFAFPQSDRLVIVGDHIGGGINTPVTAREISTYAVSTKAFASMGAYTGGMYELSGGDAPQGIAASRVSATLFDTLGVHPELGRVFNRQEDEAHQAVAVISDVLWRDRFHRDPHVVGHAIELDRKAFTIVGVMPPDFEFPVDAGRLDRAKLWIPLSLTADELSEKLAGMFGYHILARLKDGVTVAAAAQDADRVAYEIMRNYPASMSQIRIRGDVTPLREYVVRETRPVLRALFAAVSIVLLIACVNVAVLLLVRSIRRRRETAVRLALGARPSTVVRASLIEGTVLSSAGALLGFGLACLGVRTALRFLPDSMARLDSVHIDAGVALFAAFLALMTGFICSIAPAAAAIQANVTDTLKDSSRAGSAGKTHTWLRSALISIEIGIALLLLTTSFAFLQSYRKMLAVDPGFHADHVLVAGFQLPLNHYRTYLAAEDFNRKVVDRLSAEPGILAVGVTNLVPGSNQAMRAGYTIEDQPTETWKLQFAVFGVVYGDYFKSLGVPLIEGRAFSVRDRADAPLVAIINRSMAEHYWPGQSPIGRRIHVGNPQNSLPWATIVGVVANTKIGSPDQPDEDEWYVPIDQPEILFGTDPSANVVNATGEFITVRSSLPAEQLNGAVRRSVAQIDPMLALYPMETMDAVMANVEAPRRFNTDLITSFAIGALILAITGIYAVVAFSFSIRSQEIAIRMALGAQRTNIARLVLLSSAKLAVIGCALGILGSLAVSRVVKSFLFDVSATDPLIYTASVLIMIAVALLASALPAIRAASADPVIALRSV